MIKLIVIFSIIAGNFCYGQIQISRPVTLMGSRFDITLVGKDSTSINQNINQAIQEIDRIERLISEWSNDTPVSEINKNAGIKPIKVNPELIQLTQTALYFSKKTRGAFDISIVAMDKIWKFDGSIKTMPTEESIKKSVQKVNYKNILIDTKKQTIFLKEKGMKIGFGSIGKAYAAEKAKELMQKNGVEAGIINAAGDVATWGKQPDGEAWAIGIQNPFEPDEIEEVVEMDNNAVVTSGSYEKYAEINGKRYSHIIHPKTGMPSTGLISVTIIGKNATIANGLSTSIMVLGVQKGLQLMNQFPDYRFLMIKDNGNIIKN
ncbi:MAG: FAD:protein FMN transferase [Bacteroidetes bacterium]|nr:FAD:protein FMN transferase [Bacteroidota bacterium]